MQTMPKIAAAVIAEEEKQQFQKKGFVRLRGLLTENDIASLRRASDHAVGTFQNSPNFYNVTKAADAFWDSSVADNDQGSVQHDLAGLAKAVQHSKLPRLVDNADKVAARGSFFLDTSVWRRVPELADFALHGVLPAIASELLGVPAIRFHDDQLFIKEPGAVDRVAFHQDIPYLHLDGDQGCIFWVPLERVSAGGGRIGYIPGSHLWQQMFKPNIFVSAMPFPGSEGAEMPRIDGDPEKYGVEYVEMEPGDVLVHHFLAIHGSEGNKSTRPRRAFSLRYCDAAVKYRHRPGAPNQPLHRQDAKDGDLLDSTIHPVVWPPANDNQDTIAA
jgi:ectoine hydroxylase-related dioxygenase (phytanoyl-CoA dioxygenase family)